MDQNAVGKLKRRQAVGKNSQGIILVKGDPSFSSSDQILINELAFYIQSNNLKAF
jgi:precorrin-6B methylase 1